MAGVNRRKIVTGLAVSTTIAEVWTPASGRKLSIHGVVGLRESAGTALTLAFTDGTAAAAATVALCGVGANGVVPAVDFGGAIPLGAVNNKLGVKALVGVGTIDCMILGSEKSY